MAPMPPSRSVVATFLSMKPLPDEDASRYPYEEVARCVDLRSERVPSPRARLLLAYYWAGPIVVGKSPADIRRRDQLNGLCAKGQAFIRRFSSRPRNIPCRLAQPRPEHHSHPAHCWGARYL